MRRIAVVGLAAVLVGCEGGSIGSSRLASSDTVRMNVTWAVAPGVHPAADSLGDISGITIDRAGNVYATDFLAGKIWVFDVGGRLIASSGRKGQGPGEFEAPTGPAVGPDGRLYVRDVHRVSVFGPDPATGLLTRFEGSFNGPVYADWTSRRATRFDSTGALFYPGDKWLGDGTGASYVLPFAEDGAMGDTIYLPPHATTPQLTTFYRTGPTGGRMLRGLNHVPFAPVLVWDITSTGTIVSGDGRTYQLAATDREGRVVSTFHRDVAPVRIPAQEHRDSVDALRIRLDSIPVPLDEVVGLPESVKSLDVPREYPAYMAVHVDAEGLIWVRRWPLGGADRSIFDVFTPSGAFQHTVVLERAILSEPPPVLSATGVTGVTTDPLTDESVIIRFEVEGSR
ncbi:MAG: hypothetical protein IH968_15350 [Gemmatimonadetes bacterium]|nr:hypothetical protein [Gemmatimonadota bacterium]